MVYGDGITGRGFEPGSSAGQNQKCNGATQETAGVDELPTYFSSGVPSSRLISAINLGLRRSSTWPTRSSMLAGPVLTFSAGWECNWEATAETVARVAMAIAADCITPATRSGAGCAGLASGAGCATNSASPWLRLAALSSNCAAAAASGIGCVASWGSNAPPEFISA